MGPPDVHGVHLSYLLPRHCGQPSSQGIHPQPCRQKCCARCVVGVVQPRAGLSWNHKLFLHDEIGDILLVCFVGSKGGHEEFREPEVGGDGIPNYYAAIAVVSVIMIGYSAFVTYALEKPIMNWMRNRYRSWKSTTTN